MLPTPLAPLDPHKTRALTTIYAPRKLTVRKNKTAQASMLGSDIPVKPSLSPFHPLPAIGQKLERSKTKVILFDLNKNDSLDRSVKFQNALQPLTPLVGFKRRNSSEQLRKPQQLLRENTYDVLEPVFVNAPSVKKVEMPNKTPLKTVEKLQIERPKISPKTRFKKAALQVAKMSSMPERGKLLCLRERQTFNVCRNIDGSLCKLQELPQCPEQNLNKLSEIFQDLEMNGRHRDRIKKENSWF
ncbi:hypothetical protein O3G_MSEX000752 [Manduca sexta]|nr:hypothetical protein O3G_MSEX000752 [Manduca sexta]